MNNLKKWLGGPLLACALITQPVLAEQKAFGDVAKQTNMKFEE